MVGIENKSMMSSVEILQKTGISRATLNNYIKAGIIPKPLVKRSEDPLIRATKIGFFPTDVLDTIQNIRKMKVAGHKIDSIAQQIKYRRSDDRPDQLRNDQSTPSNEKSGAVQEELFSGGRALLTEDTQQRLREHERSLPLKLTIKDLHCPAYLINNKYEIDWINSEAEEAIFRENIRSIRDSEQRNVFRLLHRLGRINNELLKYHMRFFKSKNERSRIRNLYEGIGEDQSLILERTYDQTEPAPPDSIYEAYVNVEGNAGVVTPYHLYNIVFREGILFIYGNVDSINRGIAALLSSRAVIVNEILKQRMPTLTCFCVLVADLQDSTRICAELPPEEYFELINQIWRCMEEIFGNYSGTYGKHSGDGMVYYFLKDRDAHYILNALFCGLELREKVQKLSMEWKMRKGWSHNLHINMGINEGQEYFGTIPASANIEFTALGDSVNNAGRLSDFARDGAIWTTKNLVNRLSADERRQIRFGIRKSDMIMENMFSRVIDLFLPGDAKYGKFMDVATLPVTEIMDRIS